MVFNIFSNLREQQHIGKLRPDFLHGLTLAELGRRVWKQIRADRILGKSAELSFYFFLSIFPLLICLTALFGYFMEVQALLRTVIHDYVQRVAPDSAMALLDKTLVEITTRTSGGKISIGLIVALWVGSSGVFAIINSLNVAYDVKESRPWWKRRLIAIGLALAAITLMIVALALLIAGGELIVNLGAQFGVSAAVVLVWKILQWPLVLSFVFAAFYGIYWFGPNVEHPKWNCLVIGTLVAILVWLGISLGFKLYLQHFNRYSMTYGSIGAVIILLLWFYFTGIAILIGGEINSVIEKSYRKRKERE